MSLRGQLEAHVRRTVELTAADWASDVRNTSPVDTGLMRSRTTVRATPTVAGYQIEAVADTTYARFVADGTRPHTIRPRNARALRFQVGGKTVFAMRVNHPGTQPNPWFRNAFTKANRTLRSRWGR